MLDNEKPINIQPAKVARILGIIIALLVLASIAGQIIKFVAGDDFAFGFVPKFDLDSEFSIPTYFSILILLIAACLLSIIGAFNKRKGGTYILHWRILAIIFLYLSMDEAICIHEKFGQLIDSRWLSNKQDWIISFSPLVLFFAVSYFRFLLHLPAKTRLLFIIAGVLYVGGAMGCEAAGGFYYKQQGLDMEDLTYNMIVTVEETLEMAGIVLFIYALLDYIKSNVQEVRIQIGGPS